MPYEFEESSKVSENEKSGSYKNGKLQKVIHTRRDILKERKVQARTPLFIVTVVVVCLKSSKAETNIDQVDNNNDDD